jgi:hypothetical protein
LICFVLGGITPHFYPCLLEQVWNTHSSANRTDRRRPRRSTAVAERAAKPRESAQSTFHNAYPTDGDASLRVAALPQLGYPS